MTSRPDENGSGGTGPGDATFGAAQACDLDALVSIDRFSPQPWTREAFASELARTPKNLYVARSSGVVAAFAVTRIQIPEMDIVNLAVAPDLRRCGFGQFLVRSLLKHTAIDGVRSVFLEVRESNLPARKLYENLGFKETQRRRGFYFEPLEDAILLSLKIEP